MERIWNDERIKAALRLSWEEFSALYPGVSNYNGWKGARTEGRAKGWTTVHFGDDTDTILTEPDETPPDTTPERPPYEVRADGDIFINYLSRTIVTNLGKEFGSVTFSFDEHAAMRKRYANDWEDAETIPTIARDFELHPKAFERYKSMHGWTHFSDPFTDEIWAEGLTVDDAVAQTIESKRRLFHKKLKKEEWASVIKDAESWRRFEQTALRPILDAVQTVATTYAPPVLRMPTSAHQRPYSLVLCPTDLHYGKYAWRSETGTGYSRTTAWDLLLQTTEQIIASIAPYGPPERIITAIGSDFFHIDNDQGGTTNGTPQDLDGTPHQILKEGIELAVCQLDLLRQVAPLDIHYLPGNHDRLLSYALFCAVRGWLSHDPLVTIHESTAARAYTTSGMTLIGFSHGDSKLSDLPLLMAVEAREHWGNTLHRAWFTGHLHHEMVKDNAGVVTYQMPSLSGADRWHSRNGYVGTRRALAAYIVDARDGITASIMAPVFEPR